MMCRQESDSAYILASGSKLYICWHVWSWGFSRRDISSLSRWDPLWPWWRHQMETFSALLALCARNSPVPGEFTSQRPVTRSFDIFVDLRPNKLVSKQSWGWWFETISCSLWRHCNANLLPQAYEWKPRPSCHRKTDQIYTMVTPARYKPPRSHMALGLRTGWFGNIDNGK